MSEDPEWFAAKRYGLGPGLPISWQGWALTIGFCLTVAGLVFALKHRPAAMIAALIPPILAFTVIGCRTTRGGCRWRWGEEE